MKTPFSYIFLFGQISLLAYFYCTLNCITLVTAATIYSTVALIFLPQVKMKLNLSVNTILQLFNKTKIL